MVVCLRMRGGDLPRERFKSENQPKEEVFGTDIQLTSGGHSRGYPGPKLRSGRSKPWKNKHLGADVHHPKARTSTTLRDFQKLRSEELWAEFSFSERVGGKKFGMSFETQGKHTFRWDIPEVLAG